MAHNDNFHEVAKRAAEASVYATDNPHLSSQEKVFVECWYQLPHGSFRLAILIGGIVDSATPFLGHVLLAAAISVGMAIFLLVAPNRAIVLTLGALLVGGIGTLVCVCLAGYLTYHGQWIYGVYGLIGALGVDAIVVPGLWVYTIFGSKRIGEGRLHPKYAIAKRMFGTTYPFE